MSLFEQIELNYALYSRHIRILDTFYGLDGAPNWRFNCISFRSTRHQEDFRIVWAEIRMRRHRDYSYSSSWIESSVNASDYEKPNWNIARSKRYIYYPACRHTLFKGAFGIIWINVHTSLSERVFIRLIFGRDIQQRQFEAILIYLRILNCFVYN